MTIQSLLDKGLPIEFIPVLRANPVVVTLIGSSKYLQTHIQVMRELTFIHFIVIPLGLYGHVEGLDMAGEDKRNLDLLHLDKIDKSHWVYCVNPGGYVGHSTYCEIMYSRDTGKPIIYHEPPQDVMRPA